MASIIHHCAPESAKIELREEDIMELRLTYPISQPCERLAHEESSLFSGRHFTIQIPKT